MLLLENQSTVKLFCNKRFVTIVWTTNYSITVKGNGETAKTTRKPYIKVYGEVWFYELSITNILVLNNIERNFIFTYDSNNYRVIIFHKPSGKYVHFNIHKDGLHYHDNKNRNVSLVQILSENEAGYSKRQFNGAKLAKGTI